VSRTIVAISTPSLLCAKSIFDKTSKINNIVYHVTQKGRESPPGDDWNDPISIYETGKRKETYRMGVNQMVRERLPKLPDRNV
jgi:hypothetical protein